MLCCLGQEFSPQCRQSLKSSRWERSGKSRLQNKLLFWIQAMLFPLFPDSNGCRDAVLWKASVSLRSQSLHGREQTQNPQEIRCRSESASGRDTFLHPSYGSSSGKRAATLAAVPACQKTRQSISRASKCLLGRYRSTASDLIIPKEGSWYV